MSIAEYENTSGIATPTPGTTSPTPTPPQGANLIINGDMESGIQGTSGQTPDNWTSWTASGSAAFWYAIYGRNNTAGARVIGGQINGTTFNAGLYQRVTGLTPGQNYTFTGWARCFPENATDYQGWIGIDLTGQTTNGAAPSVTYWRVGDPDVFEQLTPQVITATGNALTVFLRGNNTSTSSTFNVDFDDFSLIAGGGIQATPTPTTPGAPTSTPTPPSGGQLLQNPSFEDPAAGTGQPSVWVNTGGETIIADFQYSGVDPTRASFPHGNQVVRALVTSYSTVTSPHGWYQQVPVANGQSYRLTGYLWTSSLNANPTIPQGRIGVDVNGASSSLSTVDNWCALSGQNPTVDGWLSSEQSWTQISTQFTAASSQVTVYVDSQNPFGIAWAGVHFDLVELRAIGAAATPTATLVPSTTPTRTPTLAPTHTPTGIPPATATPTSTPPVGTTPTPDLDVNDDGTVDSLDLLFFVEHWHETGYDIP